VNLIKKIDLWLMGICLARAGTGLVLITYAAALPIVQREWGMSAAKGGSISSGNQFAYAISLVVFSSLADFWGAKRVFLGSMTAGAIAAMAFALFARDYSSALILYTLVGLSLGGSYTTGLMLLTERYETAKRGTAMGYFIASTSAGYALSLLITGLVLPIGGYELSFFLTCLGAPIGAGLAWLTLWRTKNTVVQRPPQRGPTRGLLRNKPALLVIAGYTFHSWELLGMWTWTPAFLAACFAFGGVGDLKAAGMGSYVTSFFHFTGMLASFSMGFLSDRWGRATVLLGISGISSVCSFLFGWTYGWPFIITFVLGALYAFSCLGDSPVLSAALSEAADPAYLGTAFGIRSLLGFGAGAVAPLAFGLILDWTNPGTVGRLYVQWGWAFSSLGLMGLGAVAMALVYKRIGASGSGPGERSGR
jgi:MFS family permease